MMKQHTKRIPIFMVVMLALVCLMASPLSEAHECKQEITVKLSQSRISLDIWQHAKDGMNAVTFKLPVSCPFYTEVKIGDNLVSDNFRTGSLLVSGSLGKWKLVVVSK